MQAILINISPTAIPCSHLMLAACYGFQKHDSSLLSERAHKEWQNIAASPPRGFMFKNDSLKMSNFYALLDSRSYCLITTQTQSTNDK